MMRYGASYAPYIIEDREYYRLFTSMFMHFGINHIANNMLVLFVMGGYLERALGKVKYLILYLLSGVGANVVSTIYYYNSKGNAVAAGASGAVFAVVGALFGVILLNRGYLEDLSHRQIGIMIALTLYHGFSSGGVDNAAHVGGLILGFLMAILLYRKPKNEIPFYGERW